MIVAHLSPSLTPNTSFPADLGLEHNRVDHYLKMFFFSLPVSPKILKGAAVLFSILPQSNERE